MKKILVLGGSGFLGSHLCERLARLQWRVTVPTRDEMNARHLARLPLVDVVRADVHDEAALRQLVAGHDAVVNLVGVLHGTESGFAKAHAELPEKLARACLAIGVKRLVHVSALGVQDGPPDAAPSRYLRSKTRGEAALKAAAANGLLLTLLRPSVYFGAQDRFLNLFAKLQKIFPVVPLAGAETRFQPVWVEDVAQAIEHCLQDPATIGRTYELCGPDVFTLRELVQLAGRLSGINRGRGRPVIALPRAVGRLQALLMELAPGTPLMSRDNLDSMRIDNVAGGKLPDLRALGITPASLAAIAPGYLGPRHR